MSPSPGSRQKPRTPSEGKHSKDYLTTTELARLCGVSRFTIINWIKEGKIGAARTFGGHRRIPVSEALAVFELSHRNSAHDGRNNATGNSWEHCWEYRNRMNHIEECGECRTCLICGKEIDYCFVAVRQLGKEVIRCKGDCLNCRYFEQVFESYTRRFQRRNTETPKTTGTTTRKKRFLETFAYGVGRSVHELKEKAVGIRDRLTSKSLRANGEIAHGTSNGRRAMSDRARS